MVECQESDNNSMFHRGRSKKKEREIEFSMGGIQHEIIKKRSKIRKKREKENKK